MNELETIGNKPKESLRIPLTFSTPVPKSIFILFYGLLRIPYLFKMIYFLCIFCLPFWFGVAM